MAADVDTAPMPTAAADRRRPSWLMALAVAATAGLLWLGSGLTPIAWLTWLAPLPLFALATRTSARAAALGGLIGWTAGSLNTWTYYTVTLEVPAPVVAGFLLLQGLAFAATVSLFGTLLRHGRLILAALAAPALWAGIEYLVSLFSPGGTFTSLAYTQVDLLPVMQLAATTGIWGVSFLLLAVPAFTVALALVPTSRRRLAAAGIALLAVVAGHALWRLQLPYDGPATTVALAAAAQSTDSLPIASPEGQQLLDAYLGRIPAAAAAGAGIIVLPEKVFKVTDVEHAELGRRLTALAAAHRITVVIGLTLRDATGAHNIAMAYRADGAVRYDKQHLVTGWEDHFTAGSDLAVLPATAIGLAICKDLDHPNPARAYARQGATVLLVPALDFHHDGWLHSRIATVRGIENGVTVVRAAGQGRLTGSDPAGRILTDVPAGSADAIATVTVRSGSNATLYTRLGDWFAWLCLALAAWSVILINHRRRARAE